MFVIILRTKQYCQYGEFMSAMEPFYKLLLPKEMCLNKKEADLIELIIFSLICNELRLKFESDPFQSLSCVKEPEDKYMLDNQLLRQIIDEILISGEYTLQGIALYTNLPEEVIYNTLAGINQTPSGLLMRKIIEIHKSIYQDFYRAIIEKIINAMSAK